MAQSTDAPPRPAGLQASTHPLELPQRTRLASAALWLGVPLAIMLLCWRELPLVPRLKAGVVTSFGAALHMALHFGVTFGNHLIFTYGPLGFLSVPTLWYGGTGTIAVLYTLLLRFALALAMFFAARRSYGTLVGAVVALLVVAASQYTLETVPFLVLCVWMVDRVLPARQRLALMAAGGGVAGVELLNKISTGLEIAVLAVIVALAARGRRRDHLAVTLSALVLALLVAWVASGQDLGALGAYVRNSEQIVSGYSAAMGYEQSNLAWQYFAAPVALVLGVVGALQMTVDGPARRRWGILALWLAFCFFEYKDGFVSHEGEHGTDFFVAVMGGFLALRWLGRRQLVGLCLTTVLFIFVAAAEDRAFFAYPDPAENVASAVTQLGQVSIPSERASLTATGRRAIEQTHPIDPTTLSLLRGHTVHLEPFQTAVVWAYHLDWRPLPVFQSYSAYTTRLDQEDADALSSARAPQRILRNLEPGLYGRLPVFDEPLSARTMLCRYQQLRVTETWQVLGLAANRCGAITPLGSVRARWGQKVAVPAPPNSHSFVFVRIGGVQVGGLERLVSLLYKPAERQIRLNGHVHRLSEGTAADGLILRAPAGVDFSPPFNLASNSATIAVDESGTRPGAGRPITFSFFAQSVSGGPRPATSGAR